MSKYKKIIYIIILMFSFFAKGNAEYNKIFFDFKINSIDRNEIDLKKYTGKTILLVNVASNCGFTNQYADLQKIYDKYQEKGLMVIGVPTNQFFQEPENNEKIKEFCEVNFNITFPLTDKYEVIGKDAHPVYLWAKENYGGAAVPKWNFHKILINKEGKIQKTFGSSTKPLSEEIVSEIEKIL